MPIANQEIQSHPKVNILLVDDHPENLVALEAMLNDLGENLVYAHSGEEALKYLLEDDFALILLDVQMPGMDGFEAARLIHEREKTRHIPIIFLTAIYKNGDSIAQGYSTGAVDYMFKPFDPVTLKAKVASFIEFAKKRSVLQAEILKRQQAEEKLRKLNAELEHRVRQRTAALEAANRKLQAEIEERKRVEKRLREESCAKDRFLAMLAHELRNPLAPMLNVVELLRKRGLEDTQLLEWAREVLEHQVQHLARLVNDLLDMSRISQGKIRLQLAPLELAGVVNQAVEISRPLIEAHHHELTVTLPPGPLWLKADSTRLVQALANLLNNAAKYTEDSGHIWLTIEREANEAVIRVRDTGIGIPEEMLPRVFDMFTQLDDSLDRSKGGLGIGLSLVKGVVEMHGGSVRAANAEGGKGSEFEVRLPLLAKSPPLHQAVSEETASRPSSEISRRFLIIDDNVDSADALACALRASGYDVRVAYDAPSALKMVQSDPPDVVISDIGLPGMDGYGLARRLRHDFDPDRMLLIAVSGHGQEADRLCSRDAGFDHHLVKPTGLDTILSLLDLPADPVSHVPFVSNPRTGIGILNALFG